MTVDFASWSPHITPHKSRYWLSRRTRPIGVSDRSSEGLGRTALVTGASSGIGLAWCELLAAKGFDIIPIARRAGRLDAVKRYLEASWAVTVAPLVADLTDATAPATIAAELERRGSPIDFLVNNAGYSVVGRFADHTWADQEGFLRVIATSAVELSHRLLSTMAERRWGRIVNVASIAAVMSGSPNHVLYSAGKSLMVKFSEGIAAEYEPFGVHCTASLPGATDTDIFETTGAKDLTTGPAMQVTMMNPVAVARQGYRASMTGRRVVIHGRHNQLTGLLLEHAPRPLRYALVDAVTRRAGLWESA